MENQRPDARATAPFGAREAGFPGLPEIGQAGERPARSSLFDTVARMVKVQAGSNWETFFAGYGRHGRRQRARAGWDKCF